MDLFRQSRFDSIFKHMYRRSMRQLGRCMHQLGRCMHRPYVMTFVLLALAGCDTGDTGIISLSMLEKGKTFAVPNGTVADQSVLKRFPDAKIEYYNTVLDCALAVQHGKADAAVYDLPVLKNIT